MNIRDIKFAEIAVISKLKNPTNSFYESSNIERIIKNIPLPIKVSVI